MKENPQFDIHIALPGQPPQQLDPLTAEQVSALLRAADPEERCQILFSLFTGIRPARLKQIVANISRNTLPLRRPAKRRAVSAAM
jgi:integrase